MEIKERIRQLRKSRNLSQAAFAEMIECTKSQVAQWEVGNNYPKLENLIKIARVFEVSTDWILMGTTDNDAATKANVKLEAVQWKDDHIAYLKSRIQELENREASAIQLKNNLNSLQEFVIEQLSNLGGKNYQELRLALGIKLHQIPDDPKTISLSGPVSGNDYKLSAY